MGSKKERLVLPGCMQAQVGGRIQMVVVGQCIVMGCKMGGRIGREMMGMMMAVIEFMGKNLPVERPSQYICHHADEQRDRNSNGIRRRKGREAFAHDDFDSISP